MNALTGTAQDKLHKCDQLSRGSREIESSQIKRYQGRELTHIRKLLAFHKPPCKHLSLFSVVLISEPGWEPTPRATSPEVLRSDSIPDREVLSRS